MLRGLSIEVVGNCELPRSTMRCWVVLPLASNVVGELCYGCETTTTSAKLISSHAWNDTDAGEDNSTENESDQEWNATSATSTTLSLQTLQTATVAERSESAAESSAGQSPSLAQGILAFMSSNLQLVLLLSPIACCCMCLPVGGGIYVWRLRRGNWSTEDANFSSVYPEPIESSNDLPELEKDTAEALHQELREVMDRVWLSGFSIREDDTDFKDLQSLLAEIQASPSEENDELVQEAKMLLDAATEATAAQKNLFAALAASDLAQIQECLDHLAEQKTQLPRDSSVKLEERLLEILPRCLERREVHTLDQVQALAKSLKSEKVQGLLLQAQAPKAAVLDWSRVRVQHLGTKSSDASPAEPQDGHKTEQELGFNSAVNEDDASPAKFQDGHKTKQVAGKAGKAGKGYARGYLGKGPASLLAARGYAGNGGSKGKTRSWGKSTSKGYGYGKGRSSDASDPDLLT